MKELNLSLGIQSLIMKKIAEQQAESAGAILQIQITHTHSQMQQTARGPESMARKKSKSPRRSAGGMRRTL